ncbi:MAG: Gldg family protein, partial [Alkalispirochaetaceae bacterium]
ELIQGVIARLGETTGLSYEYTRIEPSSVAQLDALRERYAVPRVGWVNEAGEQRLGILALLFEDESGFEALPIRIVRSEDGYVVAGLDQLPGLIQRSINALLGVIPPVGYSVGQGESDITDTEQGAGLFQAILSERYRFVPQNLEAREVDPDVDLLVINGPTRPFPPRALEHLDEFLDRGGSLMLFLDPQTIPEGSDPEERDPWVANGVELRERLAERGIIITDEIVLDEQNYVGMRAEERRPLFQAPRLTGESLNRRSPITRELENIILFNAARLEIAPTHEEDTTVLLSSSPVSWASDALNRIGPWIEQVPATAQLASFHLAVQVEQPEGGSILAVGTSAITSPPLLAAQDKLANRVFLQNSADTLYGAPGFALLRSKGLSEPRLPAYPGSTRFLVRVVNTAAPPIVLLAVGLLLYLRRTLKQRRLRAEFDGGRS